MRLRTRILVHALFVLFCAFSWSTQPYWRAAVNPRDSSRGRFARWQIDHDTRAAFVGRAVLGGAVGFVIALAVGLTRARNGDVKSPAPTTTTPRGRKRSIRGRDKGATS